jgi:hypothetical protein
MVSSRSWKNSNFCRMMSLALCVGVAFCLLTVSAMAAGTTRLLAPTTTPSTYASELTLTPTATVGNTYTLVSNATFNSDVYRDMTVARTTAQNFTVVVSLSGGARFVATPAGGDVTISAISGSAPAGAATFTVATGGAGTSSVTFLSNITTSFTGFPTLRIAAGTAGWQIRDPLNALAAGPITVSVQTFDAADGLPVDGDAGSVNLLRATNAVIIPAAQALLATSAVVDVATSRQNFVATAPDTITVDNGATLGIGYATPVPLALAGTPFALTAADTVRLTFTSSNDFAGLATAGATTTGISWGTTVLSSTGTGTTRLINVPGNHANFNAGAQPFAFTVTGAVSLPTRTLSVAADLILATVGGSTNGGTRNLQGALTVTTWTFNGSVLVANWLSGDSNTYKSRIYLWNPSSLTGAVTVRVFSTPLITSGTQTSTELTTPGSPLSLGSLAGNSGVAIRLYEDILGPAGLNIAPYTANGGNVVVEVTIRASNVRGTCQVFSVNGAQQFGQVGLQVVQ